MGLSKPAQIQKIERLFIQKNLKSKLYNKQMELAEIVYKKKSSFNLKGEGQTGVRRNRYDEGYIRGLP